MTFLKTLLLEKPIITDGAWGTQMETLGLTPGICADTWNLTDPEKVEQVARSYVDAGSRVILTNTFRSNRLALEGYGAADQVFAINKAGAQISKRAAGDRAFVFGSIGPSGKMILTGQTTADELESVFAEQANALAAGGADAIVIETMADPAEATAALRGAKTTGLPVVVCMVYDSGKEKDRTMMGTTPEQAAEQLTAAGADVIGANCGVGIEAYVPVCRRLIASTDRPVWIKGNAGMPVLVDGAPTYPVGPDEFSTHAKALVDLGAAFIGGCCGTSPATIAALAKSLSPNA